MNLRLLSLSILLLTGSAGTLWAQTSNNDNPSSDNSLLPPDTDVDPRAPTNLREGERELPGTDVDDEEKPAPYQYPQAHMFEHPIIVGQDQLRLYNGYWQPGGYQVRDGSPFFHSVPGAPPRGPIAGGGGDNSINPSPAAGMNNPAMNNQGMNGQMLNNGQMMNGQGTQMQQIPPGYYQPQNSYAAPNNYGTQQGFNQGNGLGGMLSEMNPFPPLGQNGGLGLGMNGGSAMGGGGTGGAGGDPYNYHFGPGYYRSSEYGHFRFPYYSYRRPWFHPGFSGFNRDTNIPW